jgi:hypothetical protein
MKRAKLKANANAHASAAQFDRKRAHHGGAATPGARSALTHSSEALLVQDGPADSVAA